MTSSTKGMLTVGALLGLGVLAGLFAVQARQAPEGEQVALESGGFTVYKTPT